jgi:hypothetical protein
VPAVPGWRWGMVAVALVVLGGCAREAASPFEGGSETPRITTPAPTADLAATLLTEDDLAGVPGLSSAVASELGDAELFENPDPRGPCGTPVAPMPGPAAGRAFAGDTATLVQVVYERADELDSFVDEITRDLVPGCGPHESRTNIGTTQQVSEPTPLDTAGVGDRAIGWTTEITSAGQTAAAGVILVVADGRATALQFLAAEDSPVDLVPLARAAADRLVA